MSMELSPLLVGKPCPEEGERQKQIEKDGGAAMWKRMNLPSATVVRDTDQFLGLDCQSEIGNGMPAVGRRQGACWAKGAT